MKIISGHSKQKAQKIVFKIESGEFEDTDVDSLFMLLRAFSNNNKLFREVSDFVAHNDERNKGITNDSLSAFYLSFKFFNEYTLHKKSLNIHQPFPLYIKKLMIFQIDKCKDIDLKSKFDINKIRLKSKINSLFREDKKDKLAVLKGKKISNKNLKSIQFLLGFIGSKPAFNQDELFNEIVNVIKDNKLIFNESIFFERIDKLSISILMLLNNSIFDFKGHKQGFCKLTCEKTFIPYKMHIADINGDIIEHVDSFGNLQIAGNIVMDRDGRDVNISYPLMSTNLLTEEWCDESIFEVKPLNDEYPSILHKVANFDEELTINGAGKLSVLK